MITNDNQLAGHEANWFRRADDLLHSVFVRDYVWYPDRPASGNVITHGTILFGMQSDLPLNFHPAGVFRVL